MTDTTAPAPPSLLFAGGFNTGRLYTRDGQLIYWWQWADGWIFVRDISRMADFWIDRAAEDEFYPNSKPCPRWIMHRYDQGQFALSHPVRDTDRQRSALRTPRDFDFGPALRI